MKFYVKMTKMMLRKYIFCISQELALPHKEFSLKFVECQCLFYIPNAFLWPIYLATLLRAARKLFEDLRSSQSFQKQVYNSKT